MKSVKEIFGEDRYNFGDGIDYQPILQAIGEILVQEDEEDWQGSSLVLFRRGEEFGYLCFGWGSCGGCDAAQAVSNEAEAQELADSMERDVVWRSREEMLNWINTHDWQGDWSYSSRNQFQQKFVQRAIEACS